MTNPAGGGSGLPALSEAGTGTSGVATGVGPQVVIAVTGLAPSAAATIQEAGLFDQPMSGTQTGNIFARQTFAAITMGASDTLSVTWTVTLAHG